MKTDTIAAIATGLSNAGISIIRISGDEALYVIDKIYKSKTGNKEISKQKSHTLHYGYIMEEKEIIDEVIVAIMKAPNSYTKEDIIEIQCHGGIVVTRKILEIVLKNGARLAEPGEFTKRAFINGRIDLSQAEAISDIINAKNELSLKNSIKQLRGNIYEFIKEKREVILRDIAFIEAALDDPEHYTFEGFEEKLLDNINDEINALKKLIQESKNGKIIKEGIRTVILGKPNAGKSSLLNTIVGEERAIVTDIAGTTRDTLEETINLNGITLNIIDTAGIRETLDIIERMGVEKAIKFAEEADLILYIVDSSSELDNNDKAIIELIDNKKAIILLNKTDLGQKVMSEDMRNITDKPVVNMSIKNNVGIDQLYDLVSEMFFNGELNFNDDIYLSNERHIEGLRISIESLNHVIKSVEDGMPEDFYSIDLMSAYESLGRIIGENVEEDLINMIFKEFCMGK